MTARRILLIAIPLLLVVVLAGGGLLAWLVLGNRFGSTPVRMVVMGSDSRVRLLAENGDEQVVADNVMTEGYGFPAPSPDGRRVAYVRSDDNGSAVMVFDVASGEQRELYKSKTQIPIDLAWSPDGSHIVFLAGSELAAQIVPVDGSRPAQLVASGSPSYFAWSPDGSNLVLHLGGHTAQGGKIVLYQPSDGEAHSLLADPGLFQAPAWSLDGQDFFYVSQPPFAGLQPTLQEIKSDIIRVSADGKNRRQLVREEVADLRLVRAPASDQLAYIVIGTNGFGPLKLLDGASAGGDGAGAARTLSRAGEHVTAFFWSPSGEQIAYLTYSDQYNPQGQRTWHIVDVANGNIRDFDTFKPSAAFVGLQPFFDAYTFSFSPWSPDSTRLAYGASDGVYVIDLSAGATTKKADGVLATWVGGRRNGAR